MLRFLIILALLALPAGSRAQTVIWPAPVHGCGTITATVASAAISAATLTLCTNSPAFPGPSGTISVPIKFKVQGAATAGVYICKFGGTCTAASGEMLGVGESATLGVQNLNATPSISILAVSGSQPVYVEW
jgi:hypothetical protein